MTEINERWSVTPIQWFSTSPQIQCAHFGWLTSSPVSLSQLEEDMKQLSSIYVVKITGTETIKKTSLDTWWCKFHIWNQMHSSRKVSALIYLQWLLASHKMSIIIFNRPGCHCNMQRQTMKRCHFFIPELQEISKSAAMPQVPPQCPGHHPRSF